MVPATDDALGLWYDGYYNLPPVVVLWYAIIFPRIYLFLIIVKVNNDYFPK
jgi:hypothetical protein